MAIVDENDLLGAILEKEYGEPHSQDSHIDYFYLILRGDLIEKHEEIVTKLKKIGEWIHDKAEWPEFLVGKFPKVAPSETERHREERVSVTIRQELLLMLLQPPNTSTSTDDTPPIISLPSPPKPPHVIISRVCKYNKEVDHNSTPADDTEVKAPDTQAQNVHLDFFYLVINWQKSTDTIDKEIQTVILTLPGEWKAVTSESERDKDWRLVFVSYFPKNASETEREREWRLNKEVRDPLREHLRTLIAKESDLDSKLKVSVLLTRACK